jgi:hypothetical protein
MSIVPDMSDEGIARQFGDIVNEMPELFEALRRWEMQNRPMSMSGSFKMKSDWVSVERGGDMLRMKIGNARG